MIKIDCINIEKLITLNCIKLKFGNLYNSAIYPDENNKR